MNLFCIFFLVILNIFMPVICWAPLAKSAQDPTTIAEYISGKILDHDVNPSAHGLDGYVVFNHRVSPVLDHVDDSVTLQKLYFNRFIILTQFESIDAWQKSAGVSLVDIAQVWLETGAVINTTRYMSIVASDANEEGASPANNPEIQTIVKFSHNTSQVAYISGGNSDDPMGFGFKVVDGSLYAWHTDNDNVEYTEQITGITLTNWNVYRAVFTGGSKIEFYVNGVLEATMVSDLYTFLAGAFVMYKIENTAASGRTMYVQNLFYAEDFFN